MPALHSIVCAKKPTKECTSVRNTVLVRCTTLLWVCFCRVLLYRFGLFLFLLVWIKFLLKKKTKKHSALQSVVKVCGTIAGTTLNDHCIHPGYWTRPKLSRLNRVILSSKSSGCFRLVGYALPISGTNRLRNSITPTAFGLPVFLLFILNLVLLWFIVPLYVWWLCVLYCSL